MFRQKYKFIITILFAIVLIFPVISQAETVRVPAIYPYNLRGMAMGNAVTAVADDGFMMLSNPAGLTLLEKYQGGEGDWYISLELGARLGVDYTALYDFYEAYETFQDQQYEETGGVSELPPEAQVLSDPELQKQFADIMNNTYGFGISPLTLTFAMGGGFWNVGFTLYCVTEGAFVIPPYQPFPAIEVDAGMRGGGNVSFSINPLSSMGIDLHIGINVKVVAARQIEIFQPISQISSPNEDQFENLFTEIGAGYGLDLGIMYEITETVRVGVMFSDIYTQFDNAGIIIADDGTKLEIDQTARVQPDIKLGVSWTPDFGIIPDFIMGSPVIALDLSNFLDEERTGSSWPLWIHFGVELPFLNFIGDTYNLLIRAGINGGYIVAGATISLWYVDLNYAFYQQELGQHAGELAEQTNVFSLAIRY